MYTQHFVEFLFRVLLFVFLTIPSHFLHNVWATEWSTPEHVSHKIVSSRTCEPHNDLLQNLWIVKWSTHECMGYTMAYSLSRLRYRAAVLSGRSRLVSWGTRVRMFDQETDYPKLWFSWIYTVPTVNSTRCQLLLNSVSLLDMFVIILNRFVGLGIFKSVKHPTKYSQKSSNLFASQTVVLNYKVQRTVALLMAIL
jgi:hypothetical protein